MCVGRDAQATTDELAIASSSTAKKDTSKMNDKFTIFIIHRF
ncbi:MAG: hypothetical protein ACYT04_17255 [Nostoc sp.]